MFAPNGKGPVLKVDVPLRNTVGLQRREGLGSALLEAKTPEGAIPLVRYGLLPGHEDTGVRYGHYILLYAVEGDGFRYHDPAMRPIETGRSRWISRDQLEQAMAPTWPPRQALALGGN